ncbi:MAG: AmmeMemoRadiSam system radical SAM enzyme [Firmicutes bacterium]|nr:AmmeMemoRadiSam system radical SAM enzyme [Bacillota bacterium]
MSKIKCGICPWNCELEEGKRGFCGVRGNVDGRIVNVNYGFLSAAHLDPIEKKPLHRFMPGTKILSIGANGCNFRCPWCQNYNIAMAAQEEIDMMDTDPQEVVETALSLVPDGNIGLAFTYNEPITMYDFMLDTAKLSKEKGLVNVMVTNGYINPEPLEELLPYFDAMNIDLKYFNEEGYRKIGGGLEAVKNTIKRVSEVMHVEVCWLTVPGENDSEEELEEAAKWLASLDPEIPLHINRFFPMFKLLDKRPTNVQHLYKLAEIAQKHLKYVYIGNV